MIKVNAMEVILMKYILVINPGKISTKMALYSMESVEIETRTLNHNVSGEVHKEEILSQLPIREEAILQVMEESGIALEDLSAVMTRGGLLKAVVGGIYLVDNEVKQDLLSSKAGEHISNMGGILAASLAEKAGVNAYIMDPLSTDEMEEVATFTGIKDERRGALAHYLNLKGVTRKACQDEGYSFEQDNFIVAHLGRGFSIGAMKKGKLTDVNQANQGGPFTPERAGTLPTSVILDHAFSSGADKRSLFEMYQRQSGLLSHLGTSDAKVVEKSIYDGDEYSEKVYNAMAYQIAKEMGGMAAILKGQVKAILITGGLAYSSLLMAKVTDYISFIAPIHLYPGDVEMEALYQGAIRILTQEEDILIYSEEVEREKF